MSETSTHQSDQGSFLSGFAVGLFAGAVGYYLFGTKKGQNLKTALLKEWEEASHFLNTDSNFPTQSAPSLRDTVREVVESIQEQTGFFTSAKDVPAKKTKSPIKNTQSKKTIKKFKGT